MTGPRGPSLPEERRFATRPTVGSDHEPPVSGAGTRTGTGDRPRQRRPRRAFDPPPATFVGWFARLWVLGIVAVGVVTLLTLATGPGDLPALARLFVWASTAAFSVYLVREHRSRLPRRHRLLLFAGCAACVLLLTTALVVTAF